MYSRWSNLHSVQDGNCPGHGGWREILTYSVYIHATEHRNLCDFEYFRTLLKCDLKNGRTSCNRCLHHGWLIVFYNISHGQNAQVPYNWRLKPQPSHNFTDLCLSSVTKYLQGQINRTIPLCI